MLLVVTVKTHDTGFVYNTNGWWLSLLIFCYCCRTLRRESVFCL